MLGFVCLSVYVCVCVCVIDVCICIQTHTYRRQVAELEGDDINGIGNQNGVVPPQAFTSTEQHPLSSSSPALQSLQPSNGFFNVPSDNQVITYALIFMCIYIFRAKICYNII